MRKTAVITAIICVFIASAAGAQSYSKTGTLGLGVNGGMLFPTSSDITNVDDFDEVFRDGIALGCHLEYTPMALLTLRGGFTYAFAGMDDDFKYNPDETPYFAMPYLYFDGVLNLGVFTQALCCRFNPYLLGGIAAHFWKFTEDGISGDPIKVTYGDSDEDWKATSLGVHFGGGLEYFATPKVSLFGECKYHHIFSEDEETFGETFADLTAIEATLGLTYHFGTAAN